MLKSGFICCEMAPPQQSKPTAKPAVTFRAKPGKGEVKVSVVNIRGPFSADIIKPAKPAKPQTNMHDKSRIPVHRPQPPVSYLTTLAAGKPVSSGTLSKEPQTPTTMLQIGSCLNKDSVSKATGSPTHRLIGHSPGLRPLSLAGVSGCALQEYLIITSLHHQIQKTPGGPPEGPSFPQVSA